jgi:hypothetical protein
MDPKASAFLGFSMCTITFTFTHVHGWLGLLESRVRLVVSRPE